MQIANHSKRVNRHAASLVIETIVKILVRIIEQINASCAKDFFGKSEVQSIYALSAKFYVADQVLYIAMITPESDIFYQPKDSPDWELMSYVYTQHDFTDPEKLVKANLGFYDYIAIGNAALS